MDCTRSYKLWFFHYKIRYVVIWHPSLWDSDLRENPLLRYVTLQYRSLTTHFPKMLMVGSVSILRNSTGGTEGKQINLWCHFQFWCHLQGLCIQYCLDNRFPTPVLEYLLRYSFQCLPCSKMTISGQQGSVIWLFEPDVFGAENTKMCKTEPGPRLVICGCVNGFLNTERCLLLSGGKNKYASLFPSYIQNTALNFGVTTVNLNVKEMLWLKKKLHIMELCEEAENPFKMV